MYLYQFESGEVQQHDVAPTAADVAAIADGIMRVITFRDGQFFDIDTDGEAPVPKCSLWSDKDSAFHAEME